MLIATLVVKKEYRRRRIAGNLVPCYCAASVMYSRTLPQLLIRKTRPCLALHPPMVMGRFAFCRNPNLLHISLKSGLYQISLNRLKNLKFFLFFS